MNKNISRREALRLMALTATAFLVSCAERGQSLLTTQTKGPSETATQTPSQTATQPADPTATSEAASSQEASTSAVKSIATVYMTKIISADGLMQIYEAHGFGTCQYEVVNID